MIFRKFLCLLFLGACAEKPFGEDLEVGLQVNHEDEEHFTFRLSSVHTEATLYFFTPEMKKSEWKQIELNELGTGTDQGEGGFTLYSPPQEGWVGVVGEARTPETGDSAKLCGLSRDGNVLTTSSPAGESDFDLNLSPDPDMQVVDYDPFDCVIFCDWYPAIEEGEVRFSSRVYPEPPIAAD